MRYTDLQEPVRSARRRLGLTQAQLAARSGTSRVTVARLEGGVGRDVRVGTLAALCQALGLELGAQAAGALPALETQLARERVRARRLDLRLRHALLAARLLRARPREAGSLVGRARATVDRWERDALCSMHYIARWRAMLAGPVERVAVRLLEPGEWQDALFQNTPWASELGPSAP